jgi:heme-degrading monooxygenase HmoA
VTFGITMLLSRFRSWNAPARMVVSREGSSPRLFSPILSFMIARIWRGVVRRDDAAAYADYIAGTGMTEYRSTPGNQGAWMLRRDDGDRSEIVTFSLWDSTDSIRAFAGDDIDQAVFYPDDDRFLIERDLKVRHYEVVA